MNIKEQICINEKKWYAIKCKYKCEKTLVADLLSQDVEAYVPMQRRRVIYTSGKKYSEVALISCHVFVKINRSQYIQVLRHHHVYQFLNFSGTICPIPQPEMDLMRRVVGECDNISIEQSAYCPGDEVEIISGELTGLTGILVQEINHNFKISMTSLGMGLAIYVDPKDLMKVRSIKKVA